MPSENAATYFSPSDAAGRAPAPAESGLQGLGSTGSVAERRHDRPASALHRAGCSPACRRGRPGRSASRARYKHLRQLAVARDLGGIELEAVERAAAARARRAAWRRLRRARRRSRPVVAALPQARRWRRRGRSRGGRAPRCRRPARASAAGAAASTLRPRGRGAARLARLPARWRLLRARRAASRRQGSAIGQRVCMVSAPALGGASWRAACGGRRRRRAPQAAPLPSARSAAGAARRACRCAGAARRSSRSPASLRR